LLGQANPKSKFFPSTHLQITITPHSFQLG